MFQFALAVIYPLVLERKEQKAHFSFVTAPTARNENNEAQSNNTELPKKIMLCADRLEPDKLK